MPNRLLRATYFLGTILLVLWGQAAWAQDEMFVTNGNNSVTVYVRTANGDIAPIRTLIGGATGLSFPGGVAVDLVNDELFVANGGNDSVTVYARTASGDAAPLRTIAGALTGLNNPVGLAVDLVNNELAVASILGNSVTVFSRAASGDVAPVRAIIGGSTGLSSPVVVAVDALNNELAVSNAGNTSVTIFARTANGNTPALRTLVGAATSLALPEGLVVDTVNDELLVVNGVNGASGNSVTAYARTANGNVAPRRKISGAATGLCGPEGLAVDLVNNEIAVANPNSCGNSVVVFARTANGDVAPLRTLAGASTGIDTPGFLAITAAVTSTCAEQIGLARGRCLLDAALAAPLCGAETIPTPVDRSLRGRLGGAAKRLGLAEQADGRKQARLVKKAQRLLAAAKRGSAAAAGRKKKPLSAACATTIAELTDAVGNAIAP